MSSRKREKSHPFEVVQEITETHAEKFVDFLYERWTDTGVINEAITNGAIMTWPSEHARLGRSDPKPDQRAYLDTQDAIAEEIERTVRPALMTAFRDGATRILGLKSSAAKPRNGQEPALQLDESVAENIRTIFLRPKESYEPSEVAALFGVTTHHYLRHTDAPAIRDNSGRVDLEMLIFDAIGHWSLAEIESALGSEFVEVFPQLCATETLTVAIPKFIGRWMRESELPRLSNLRGSRVTPEAVVQNTFDEGVWGADDLPAEVAAAATPTKHVTEAVKRRMYVAR